jgi:ABC-type Zn uptake system ZnuABC Zn-binding protein ZnuA
MIKATANILQILVLLLSLNAFATSVGGDGDKVLVVAGKVIDATTGEPLAGAKIEIEGTNQTIYSGIDGDFALQMTSSNVTKKITISQISYKQEKVALNHVLNNSFQDITIKLSSE